MGLLQSILGYIGAGRAGTALGDSYIAAEHGVMDASQQAQAGIRGAIGQGRQDIGAGLAGADWNADAADLNLKELLAQIQGGLQPYQAAGAQGTQGLMDYAASKPTFEFKPDDYFNSPAYQFQLEQGQNAIQNSASARGLGSSGAALKELTNYGQGLASTYYNDAFNRAKSTFDTNQNTTLQNLSALINAGEFGTSQGNAATLATGSQQTDLRKLMAQLSTGAGSTLAGMGLEGETNAGRIGLAGSQMAGDYAVGAGAARAGGIMGQYNNLGSGIGSLASLLMGLGIGGKP